MMRNQRHNGYSIHALNFLVLGYLIFSASIVLAQEDAESKISKIEEIASRFQISGKIETVAKIQDSYYTPLDFPFGVRSGANYREDQHFRAKTTVDLSYGKPSGKWFGIARVKFDANDPDNDANEDNPDRNQSEPKLDTDYAFVMYRPFEVAGGRPLGIMLGVIPVKATANGAYFHNFSGDLENDFIFYNGVALPEAPGVNIDLHVSKDTGIGFAYTNGVDDGSEIVTFVDSDSTQNCVFWAEAKKWGFGFNGAVQFVEGENGASKQYTTPEGNTYFSYAGKTRHILFNTLLSYRFDVGGLGFMPAIGYELVKGKQNAVSALPPPLDQDRDVKWENFQVGLNVFTNFFNTPGKLSILYTKSKTDDIGDTSNETAFPLAGVDHDIQLEYGLDVTDGVTVGTFYYKLYARDLEIASSVPPPLAAAYTSLFEFTDTQSYGVFTTIRF